MPDRILRDELWRNYRFLGLPNNDARILFLALINQADDYGNTAAHPMAIKGMSLVFAAWEAETIIHQLNVLHDADLIRMYQEGGEAYLHIPRFKQRLRYLKGKHPRPSKNLECPRIKELEAKVSRESDSGLTTVSRREEKRREEKGGNTKGSRFTLTALPDDWKEFALAENESLDVGRVFQKFRDHWLAQSGAKGVKKDWVATWRNWVRREIDYNPPKSNSDYLAGAK